MIAHLTRQIWNVGDEDMVRASLATETPTTTNELDDVPLVSPSKNWGGGEAETNRERDR
jgi:hypothetical protein